MEQIRLERALGVAIPGGQLQSSKIGRVGDDLHEEIAEAVLSWLDGADLVVEIGRERVACPGLRCNGKAVASPVAAVARPDRDISTLVGFGDGAGHGEAGSEGGEDDRSLHFDGLYDWLDRKLQFGVEVFEAYEDAVINAAIEIKVGDLLSSLSTLLTRF